MSDLGDLIGLLYKDEIMGCLVFLFFYWWFELDYVVVLFFDEFNWVCLEIL